ncbi:MAG: GntR family transcriptional regulator [Candidatus Omnitrophota bacterium]
MLHLREQINEGALKAGDPLPTREKLMKEHGLSLSTVTRAISELERQGWLVSRQGSGTFVVKRSADGDKETAEPNLVGLIMPVNYSSADGLVSEIVEEGIQKNINVMIMFSPEDEEAELNMARTMFDKEVRAMIWFPVQPKKHVSVASLFGKNKKPVIIGEKVSEYSNPSWYIVRRDYYGGAREAIEHFLQQGHVRIAYAGPKGGESDFGPIPERWNAYKDAMKRRDLWNPDALVINPAMFKEWHVNLTRLESIFRGSHPPTALAAYDDIIALEAARALKTLGLRIPDDIAIIGHGDFSYGRYSEPRLSTVSPCTSEYADAIIRVLCNELGLEMDSRYTNDEREIVISQRLLLRESTHSKNELMAAN